MTPETKNENPILATARREVSHFFEIRAITDYKDFNHFFSGFSEINAEDEEFNELKDIVKMFYAQAFDELKSKSIT